MEVLQYDECRSSPKVFCFNKWIKGDRLQILLMVLTGMSGWMRPPAHRCPSSVRRPGVAWWEGWCSLYPGGRREGCSHTNSYIQSGCIRDTGLWERWHLVQGHAQGADEAAVVVLQSDGGGRPAGMRRCMWSLFWAARPSEELVRSWTQLGTYTSTWVLLMRYSSG